MKPNLGFEATYASQGAADLLEWVREKELILLNPTEISTHKGGGTLDLAFSSLAGAKCEIPSDLHTTTDHETMVTTLTGEYNANEYSERRLQYDSINEVLFKTLLRCHSDLPDLLTVNDIKNEAEKITKVIRTALQSACPRAREKNHGTVWWNKDC